MKTWKKNLVAAAVLVTVCTGIYVNWLYTEQSTAKNLTDTLDVEKVMSDDTLLLDGDDAVMADAQMNTATDYFAAVRLSRQQARDSALSLLQDAAAQEDADETVKNQVNDTIQTMADYTITEAQIENLVTAKGYIDCVAFIGEDSISLAVAAPDGGLTQADTARIVDVVQQTADFSAQQIKIIEVS